MSKAFILIACMVTVNVYGQFDRMVPVDELQEDFWVYRASLEEAHPGLYWYRTKAEMDFIFDEVEKKLTRPISEKEFFRELRAATAKIGCLHTGISHSLEYHKAFIHMNAAPFPFEIKLDENRMYVYQNLSADTTIEKASEIISINDQRVSELIPYMVDRIPNDGFGDGWSRYALERSFRYYYQVLIKDTEAFQLKLVDAQGFRRTASVPGRLEKERNQIIRERYPETELEEPVITLNFDEETRTAVLRVTRLGHWKIGDEKYKFKKVAREKMKQILDRNVENVIIDMGDRGGGNELLGLELLTYFMKAPYTPYKAVEFKTKKFDVARKYSTTSWLEYNLLSLYLRFEKGDSTQNWKNYRGLKPYKPRKNRFEGDVYLIVGGSTASATSDFAAFFEELELGPIIGTETGGSYLGNTSNWEFPIVLPNTKLRLALPLARYLTNVKPGESGRGIVPDHIVPTSIDDKLNDVDAQLNFTLDLIRRKQEGKKIAPSYR